MSLDYFQTSCGVRSHTQTVTDKPKNTSTADKSHPNDLLAENSGQTQWMTIYLSASLTVTVVLLGLMVITAYILKRRKFHTTSTCLIRRDVGSFVKAVPDTDQCKRISINTEIIAPSYRLDISRFYLNSTVLFL